MASPSFPKLPHPPVEFSPLSLIRMLWLHKLSIVVIWLAITGITAGVVYKLPATYTAEAQILVDPQKIPERFVASMVNTDVQDRLATISQQILSTARLQKVIDDFNLYSAERKNLINEEIINLMRKSITVKLDRGWTNNRPGAFRIGYSGGQPAVVAQVTNRLANLFIEENMRTREVQVEGTSEFIEAQLQDSKKRLTDIEATIAAYKAKYNGELPEQATAVAGTLNRLQLEQTSNREAITRAEATKSMLQSTLGLAESTVDALSQRAASPPVMAQPDDSVRNPTPAPPRARKLSEVLEAQLTELRARLGDAHPEVKRTIREVAAAKENEARAEQDAAKASENLRPPAPKVASTPAPSRPLLAPTERPEVVQARERAEALKNQIALADKEIASRQADQDKLAKGIIEYQNRLNMIPVREQEIAQIMRDHTNLLTDYQSLQAKNSAAKISTDMELRQKSERFAINDPAQVPEIPTSPNRVALDALGSLVGLVVGGFIAFSREFKNGRLLGAWELPSSVPVLARVPRITLQSSGGGLWGGWSWARRGAVMSLLLIPLLSLLALGIRFGL